VNCKWFRENLSAYIDGELDFLKRWRIKRHLKRCSGCGREYRQLKKIHKLSKLVILAGPEPRFYERLRERFPEIETIKYERAGVFEKMWIALPRGGKAAIIVGLVLILFFSVIYPHLFPTSLNIDGFEKEYLLSRETLTYVREPATSLILINEGGR